GSKPKNFHRVSNLTRRLSGFLASTDHDLQQLVTNVVRYVSGCDHFWHVSRVSLPRLSATVTPSGRSPASDLTHYAECTRHRGEFQLVALSQVVPVHLECDRRRRSHREPGQIV